MPKHPDYILKAVNRRTETKATVGAGWDNQDGTISVQLNTFIKLEQDGNLALVLYKQDHKDKRD